LKDPAFFPSRVRPQPSRFFERLPGESRPWAFRPRLTRLAPSCDRVVSPSRRNFPRGGKALLFFRPSLVLFKSPKAPVPQKKPPPTLWLPAVHRPWPTWKVPRSLKSATKRNGRFKPDPDSPLGSPESNQRVSPPALPAGAPWGRVNTRARRCCFQLLPANFPLSSHTELILVPTLRRPLPPGVVDRLCDRGPKLPV